MKLYAGNRLYSQNNKYLLGSNYYVKRRKNCENVDRWFVQNEINFAT